MVSIFSLPTLAENLENETSMSITSSSSSIGEETSAPVIRHLSPQGTFIVENPTIHSIKLSLTYSIEDYNYGQWQTLDITKLTLKGSPCDNDIIENCIVLEPGKSIEPEPWTGFSCPKSCGRKCFGNFYYGSGKYRIVVKHCHTDDKFYSAEFNMPSNPSDNKQ